MKYPVEQKEFLKTVKLSSNEAVKAAVRKTGARSVSQFLFWHEQVQSEERRRESRALSAAVKRGEW